MPHFVLSTINTWYLGAPSSDDERIIGGTPVTPDPLGQITTFPYVVSIEDDRSHICGGFIYSPKWVVTTASCIEKWADFLFLY
jgi:secreted trypsin-like serine protease